MNDDATIRDLQGRTQYAPGPPEYDRDAVADPPLPEAARPIFGAAIVTANSGGAAYTITEARRSGSALAKLTVPDGFVDRSAHAIGGCDSYQVDDEVLYWQVPKTDGSYATYIERGAGVLDSPVTMSPSDISVVHSLAAGPYDDTWDRTNQGANKGVVIRVATRVLTDGGYAATSYRDLTFDSAGMLSAISAEEWRYD